LSDTKKSLFKKGAYVYVEGDEDIDDVFIVERGAVELVSENKKIKRYKPLVTDGEIFGFITALIRRPRMESAVALKDTVVIAVNRSRFIYLVQQNPEIAIKIIRYFAEELRLYDEMMFSLKESDSSMVPEELKLFNVGEYYYKSKANKYALYVLTRYVELYPNGIEIDAARSMLAELSKSGAKQMPEPVKSGVYKLFADGQMVFCENEPGEELYIIKEGKVKITKVSENNEILLSVLREGDIFGELAIVSEKPRNASAICIGRTALLPIRKETLSWVLSKSPGIINKIFMAISQRIWFTYINLEAKLYNKPITRVYALIENRLLQDNVSLKSKEPAILNFSIEELLRATGVSGNAKDQTANLLLEDTNLEFNFGQLTVRNPSILLSRANFYKSRDMMHTQAEPLAQKAKPRTETVPSSEEEPAEPDSLEIRPDAAADTLSESNPESFEEPVDIDDNLKLPSQEINID
jgi:CRP/FNR family transcriptional regulator